MLTLNNTELALLAVLGYPELTSKALRLYANKSYLFAEMFCPHLNLMWNAYVATLKKYRADYGLAPGRDLVAAALVEAVQAARGLPEELKAKCDTILQRLTSGDVPPLEDGERLLRNLASLDGNRKIAAKLNDNADLLTLQQTLDASRRTIEMLDGGGPASEDAVDFVFNPLKDIKKLAKRSVRMPTGVNWLDDISSGGGREGDLWLILGAPGGGKTAMAVQYACAQAMLGKDTLWATYEQSLEGDISERMIAYITDTSLDRIRDVGFDNLDKEIQDKFWASVAGVDDRLTALDMTRVVPDPQDPEDYGGVLSIRKQFAKLKAAGRAPKTLILDWFGSMMSRIAANLGMDLSQCYRFKAQEEINNLIQFARQERILVIVFHQLDVKAASARPTYLADATHAQDMHNMQNFFDLVALIGVRDVHDVCWFSSGKSRKGQKVVRTLRLIGDRSRFVMEDGWMPNRDGNFYRPTDVASGNDLRGVADEYARELF